MNILKKTLLNIELFKIVCLVVSIFLVIPYFSSYVSYLKILHVYALILIIFDFFNEKRLMKNKGKFFVYLLILFYLITIVFNRELLSISHLSDFGYFCIQTLLLFSYRTNEKNSVSLKLFSYIYVTLLTVLNILALLMFVTQFQQYVNGGYIGMYPHEYRLCGLFGNPAVLSFVTFFAVALCIICLTFKDKKSKGFIKGLIFFSLVLNYIVLVLANGRATILASYVLFAFLFLLNGHLKDMKKIKIVSIVLIVSVCNFALIKTVQVGATMIVNNHLSKQEEKQNNVENENESIIKPENTEQDGEPVVDPVEKNPITSVEVSRESEGLNGRGEIWKQGINVFLRHPFFGVGLNNVNDKLVALGTSKIEVSGSLHNTYLEILVAFGFIGFLMFIFLGISFLDNCHRYLKRCKNHSNNLTVVSLISALFAILVIGLADSSLLFSIYPSSVVLFCLLGFIYSEFDSSFEKEKINHTTYLYEFYCKLTSRKQEKCEKSICFVNDSLGGGGAEKILINVVNALSDTHNVTVLTLWSEDILEKEINSNVKLISFDHFHSLFLKRILYWIERNHLPVTFINCLYLNNKFRYYVAFLEGLPTKLISQTKEKDSYKYAWVHIDMQKQNWVSKYFKNLEVQKKAYNTFDKILCVSESVKVAFNEVFGYEENTFVQFNLVDTKKVKKLGSEVLDMDSVKNNKKRIYSIGRLNNQKGFDRLIEACARLKEENYELELWLIGEGNKRKELESQLLACNMENCTKLLGFQSNPFAYAKYCDLFVCSSRAEGYSTVITESLVLGKPIVSTLCSGVKEQLGDSEYGVVVENSVDGIYTGIKALLNDEALFKHYENMAKKRGADFDYDKIKSEYEILFQG